MDSWAYFFLALRLEGVGEPRAAPKPRATLEPRAKTLLAQDDEMNDMPKKKKKKKKTHAKKKTNNCIALRLKKRSINTRPRGNRTPRINDQLPAKRPQHQSNHKQNKANK